MNRYIRELDTIAQKSAFYSASHVPNATRKYSGQAQASTRIGVGSPDTSVTLAAVYAPNAISNPIGRAVSRFQTASRRISIGTTVYVTNNLPYIRKLEYGYGDLMFAKAISKWQQDVERAVNDIN